MHLLLNDTSGYHQGCRKVVEALEFDRSIATGAPIEVNWREYELVTLNGEGTLHQGRENALKFLTALRDAQKAGCRTRIVNTVWQQMPHSFDDVLQGCEYVRVREIFSQRGIRAHGVEAEIVPDLSIQADVTDQRHDHVPVYEGQYFLRREPLHIFPRIDIFSQSWDEIVNRLRHADLLITGRHHEMYAAIKARCRYIAVPGNTRKNEGVAATCKVYVPNTRDAIDEVLRGDYDEQYDKIFDWAASFVAPSNAGPS